MRLPVSTLVLRTAAVGGFAALWMAACLNQPAVSADRATAKPAGPQFDDLAREDLRVRMASAAAKLAAADEEAGSDFGNAERRRWDFWPSRYPGLRMDHADDAEQDLADQLLRLGLSESGYGKLRLIQALEPLNPWSSPYYSALIFGDPAAGQAWGWRYQGHHMSVNFTLGADGAIVTTPLFLGTQPLSSPTIASGAKPLAEEESLARKLYQALKGEQRSQATIDRPPYAYLPERTPRAKQHGTAGISAAVLSVENRETLDALLACYINNIAPALAEGWRRAFASEAGEIRFAWAGPDQPGRDHYYRLSSGDLLIEYDSRDGGSHIHSVWRSISQDFGGDPLRAHYADAAHPPSTGW